MEQGLKRHRYINESQCSSKRGRDDNNSTFVSRKQHKVMPDYKVTNLIRSSAMGWTRKVQTLLKSGECDINAVENTGKTALIYAVQTGRPRVVDLLLDDFNVNVNVRDNYGKTALNYAYDYISNVRNMHPAVAEQRCAVLTLLLGYVNNGGSKKLYWA